MSNFFTFRRNWWAGLLLVVPVIVMCDRFVDLPVALLVKESFNLHPNWARRASGMPDLLLVAVIVTSAFAGSWYLVRARLGKWDTLERLLLLVALGSPVSYLAKAILKPLFGRLNARLWLEHPEWYGFHWFRGGHGFEGFPSGHMLVLVTVLASATRLYPRVRYLGVFLAVVLAFLLVVTGYHFVGDIIAGAYAGLAVESVLYFFLCRTRSFSGPNPPLYTS